MADNTPKRVLYISYDGMTDSLGQSQVIPYLIGLTKRGYSFTILSCEKPANFNKHKSRIQEILDKADITWEPIFYTKNPPVLSTVFDYYKLQQQAQILNSKHKFDIIHCRSYISSLVGLWMTKKYKTPFVFDMRGFWADERVDGNLWKLSNPVFKLVYKFFKNKEVEFLNHSAAIISLTEAAKAEMIKWNKPNFKVDKITVIPCCVDTGLFDPDKASSALVKQSLKITDDDFIIGYLGSIGTWYMVDEMMQFFFELKNKIKNAKFLFVSHDDHELIKDKVLKHNISLSDVIITQATRDEVPALINIFNYGLFFIKPAYSKIASSPTKQGEIMAMGVPVICNSGVGDTDQIVTRYNAGIIIKDANFENAINEIISTSTYNRQSIRDGAINYFSLANGVEKYSNVYKSIINEH